MEAFAYVGEPEPCVKCGRTDWIVSVIVDGRRLCGGCKRRLVSEPAPLRVGRKETGQVSNQKGARDMSTKALAKVALAVVVAAASARAVAAVSPAHVARAARLLGFQQGDSFAVQDSPDATGVSDLPTLRKFQVGHAAIYTGRPGQRPFPDGVTVRPGAANPQGQRVWVRSDDDGTWGLAHPDELAPVADPVDVSGG